MGPGSPAKNIPSPAPPPNTIRSSQLLWPASQLRGDADGMAALTRMPDQPSNRLITPSQLALFSRSPQIGAWWEELLASEPDRINRPPAEALEVLLREQGGQHERQLLTQLKQSGRSVVRLSGGPVPGAGGGLPRSGDWNQQQRSGRAAAQPPLPAADLPAAGRYRRRQCTQCIAQWRQSPALICHLKSNESPSKADHH